jgi:hypothetical protein
MPHQEHDRWRALTERIGCPPEGWKEPITTFPLKGLPHYEFQFDGDDARLSRLLELLRREGKSFLERWDEEYTDDELRAAPLLKLGATTREIDLGRRRPEEFDFSRGCPRCGTGALQAGSLHIKAGSLPRRAPICQSLDRYTFVTEPLHEALAGAGLRGLELRQARSMRGEPLAWWQLMSNYEMPPMKEEVARKLRGADKDGCHFCKRDNNFGGGFRPVTYVYPRAAVRQEELPDVTHTFECFGISGFKGNGYLAHGNLLVSPKVFDIFRRLKVRRVAFEPVRIED